MVAFAIFILYTWTDDLGIKKGKKYCKVPRSSSLCYDFVLPGAFNIQNQCKGTSNHFVLSGLLCVNKEFVFMRFPCNFQQKHF